MSISWESRFVSTDFAGLGAIALPCSVEAQRKLRQNQDMERIFASTGCSKDEA
jgi:hypothetical protein